MYRRTKANGFATRIQVKIKRIIYFTRMKHGRNVILLPADIKINKIKIKKNTNSESLRNIYIT